MESARDNVWLAACLLSSAVLVLSGCAGEDSGDDARREVLVLAAASTTEVMEEIRQRFNREHHANIRTSYAGSSTLAQQIVNGARADVFVSANRRWADYLEEQAVVARRRDLLENRLVVIVPADSTLTVQTPEDLLSAKIKYLALAEPGSAPAGIYAKQALVKLGLWEELAPKVVSGADVRLTMAYVQRAEAEAGIVYATDAAVSRSVKVALEMPPELTEPIRYPVLLLGEGSGNKTAESFYRYLSSHEATRIFKEGGFEVVDRGR